MTIQSIAPNLRLFSVREWVFCVIFLVACTAGTFATGLSVIHRLALGDFQRQSETRLNEIGKNVVELSGVLKSLLGMHYASDEFAGLDINAFAEQLRFYSPFVNTIGIFVSVDSSMRDEFESSDAAQYNGRSFTVHTYSPDGKFTHHVSTSGYSPVISADPLDEKNAGALGIDLSSDADLSLIIENNISTGTAAVVKTPEGWNVDGDVLLLQPVYFSESPPDTVQDRQDLYAGGIWVAVNADALLDEIMPEKYTGLQVSTTAPTGYAKNIYQHTPHVRQDRTNWTFDSSSNRSQWSLGGSVIEAVVSEYPVASAPQMSIVYLGSVLAMLLCTGIISILYQRREVTVERTRSLTAITLERENAKRTLDSISDAVLAVDTVLNITFVNATAEQWFFRDSRRPVGMPLSSVPELQAATASDDTALDWLAICHSIHDEGQRILDIALTNNSSSKNHSSSSTFQLSLSSTKSYSDAHTGYTLVLQDVSKERELTNQLQHQAHHDPLTGIFNRFYFDMQLEALAVETLHSHRQHALCFLDLDQFKIVNDTCGHPAGDRLLCELTEAMLQRLRKNDIMARLGGDEFAVILCDVTEQQATEIAGNLFAWFETAVFKHEEKVFPVRCSMGVVSFSSENAEVSQIMSSADIACYSAKASGRNALVVFSESDESMAAQREDVNWLPTLEQALANDEFVLLVSPIAKLDHSRQTYDVTNYQFLLRLVDEDGNEIAPARFIKAAERFDLMRSIDRWVVNRCCQLLSENSHLLPDKASFLINLSAHSAADADLFDYIAGKLEHYGIPPHKICFKMTETAAIAQFDKAALLFRSLQKMGSQVMLDDFGAGVSSFAYLRNLSVDILKIDAQYISDVADSKDAVEIVRAMRHVATTMGLKTAAECVDNQEILDAITSLEIDYAHGYLFGKPSHFDTILEEDGISATHANRQKIS